MGEALTEDSIFSLVPKAVRKEHRKIFEIVAGPLEHLLGLRQCAALYDRIILTAMTP